MGEVSAQVFWNLFSVDLQDMLKGTIIFHMNGFFLICIPN